MKAILAKLHAIMTDLPFIEKNAKVEHGKTKFKYASEFAIKTAVHAALVKHNVVFQLEISEPTICKDLENNQYNNDVSSTILKCKYTFWDVDSGEKLDGAFASSGPARDDKGHWAATTNAIKYILTSIFLIPTGDDCENPENFPDPNVAPKPNATQRAAGAKSKPKATVTNAPKEQGSEPKGKPPRQEGENHKDLFWKMMKKERTRLAIELPMDEIVKFTGWLLNYMDCKPEDYERACEMLLVSDLKIALQVYNVQEH